MPLTVLRLWRASNTRLRIVASARILAAMYRKQFQRHEVPGTARFVTFSCFQRIALLSNDQIKSEFVRRLTVLSESMTIDVLAWVVMPNHIHLVLFSESTSIAYFLQQLKGPFSQSIIRRWKTLDATILHRVQTAHGHRFWQSGGGYDRNVVGDELLEKIRYCHANPVTRGLVARSVDWPWSSARRYESREDGLGPAVRFELLPTDRNDLT